MLKLLIFIFKSQTQSTKSLSSNREDIQLLKAENKKLMSEVKYLSEYVVFVDQYTRKGAMTITIGCTLFSKFFGRNPVLVDLGELITRILRFLKLDNVYLHHMNTCHVTWMCYYCYCQPI